MMSANMTDLAQVDGSPRPRSPVSARSTSGQQRRDEHSAPIDQITDAAWETTMLLNLTSVMRLTRALVPPMKERKWAASSTSRRCSVSAQRKGATLLRDQGALTGLAARAPSTWGPIT